jgi:hypothetical protein
MLNRAGWLLFPILPTRCLFSKLHRSRRNYHNKQPYEMSQRLFISTSWRLEAYFGQSRIWPFLSTITVTRGTGPKPVSPFSTEGKDS